MSFCCYGCFLIKQDHLENSAHVEYVIFLDTLKKLVFTFLPIYTDQQLYLAKHRDLNLLFFPLIMIYFIPLNNFFFNKSHSQGHSNFMCWKLTQKLGKHDFPFFNLGDKCFTNVIAWRWIITEYSWTRNTVLKIIPFPPLNSFPEHTVIRFPVIKEYCNTIFLS